ncbi:hypothetical protein A6A04_16505 [Paramagnetospirillum marisnigri]|uniref:Uncharacterized protein n=1 Tax=Paramagnetospirillum marisnigri TaxID=1285242 RepID=A0A178MQF6_9PROT|nr:hypothetical protein A6A04_16505 [Paramagnetospirillum marisnigri]
MAEPGLSGALRQRHGLLSPCALLLSREQEEAVRRAVRDLYAVLRHPAVAAAVLVLAGGEGLADPGAGEWILGFDFHLEADGPRLIEINTNPGGMLAVAVQGRALTALDPRLAPPTEIEGTILAAFHQEWRQQRPDRPLASVAVVDDDPPAQYLWPEFQLYRRLFERAGIRAEVQDAAAFAPGSSDLVYNRLVDFALEAPGHAALAQAWRSGETVLTPGPRAHFQYSDKRAMTLLCDPDALTGLGVAPDLARSVARVVPPTVLVRAQDEEALWDRRRDWFFKPVRGHAGKAAYRGEKLSRSTWATILASPYVAQRYVPPSRIHLDHAETSLKLDIRANAWRGEVAQLAARLYQGQTTNFRTLGGGFAPVFAA